MQSSQIDNTNHYNGGITFKECPWTCCLGIRNVGSREQSLPGHSLLSTVLEACEQVNRSGVWCSFNLVTDIEKTTPQIYWHLYLQIYACVTAHVTGIFLKKGKLKILRRERLLIILKDPFLITEIHIWGKLQHQHHERRKNDGSRGWTDRFEDRGEARSQGSQEACAFRKSHKGIMSSSQLLQNESCTAHPLILVPTIYFTNSLSLCQFIASAVGCSVC